MSVEMIEHPGSDVLEITVSGKLGKADYELFAPSVEDLIERRGKLRILLILRDFRGWTAGALWEDVKFDAKHFNDIRKLAVVGERVWEKGMTDFCKPFTTAEVRFFTPDRLTEAQRFVGLEEVAATAPA